jgi:hypothetical protein
VHDPVHMTTVDGVLFALGFLRAGFETKIDFLSRVIDLVDEVHRVSCYQ